MNIDITVECPLVPSPRVQQCGAMFDVPLPDVSRVRFQGDLPIEDGPWSVGAIVGPSGSGKSTILRQIFGEPLAFEWSSASVIDDIDRDPIVVDEFTSVVDRRVGKICAHAVQKYVRRNERRFVAATCHEDVLEWLQPDWALRTANMTFARLEVGRRPFWSAKSAESPGRRGGSSLRFTI